MTIYGIQNDKTIAHIEAISNLNCLLKIIIIVYDIIIGFAFILAIRINHNEKSKGLNKEDINL